MQSLPGWQTKIREVSNGVYMVTLTDAYGRKSEITDMACDETIERAIAGAFDIEKQISRNWNKFLFDLCRQALPGTSIIHREYNENIFGSWYVEKENAQIVLDGKYSRLIVQTKHGREWRDRQAILKDELTYEKFIMLIFLKD